MEENAIDKRIDERTVEAFETVCGNLGHDVIGQFSIFDGAWQVIQMAATEDASRCGLSPAECQQLRDAVAEIILVVESVMRTSDEIRAFLFPKTGNSPDSDPRVERTLNQARWSPYDRAAWNTFFAEVCAYIDRVFLQLDQIETGITRLRELKIEQALETFDHFEPMLATNLRERLALVVQTYALDPDDAG